MNITSEALRGQFTISKLCQVFAAKLHSCMEEGFPRHLIHYFPSPVVLEDRGKKIILPEPQLGCIFGLVRYSPLNIPSEDQVSFAHRPPFETIYLAMPVGGGTHILHRRTRFLQDSENLLLDLMEKGERLFVVAVSHRRLIHGCIVVRHQPAALFDFDGNLLWLHPAARRFGLIQIAFPCSQGQRYLDVPSVRAREWVHFQNHDKAGMPAWYGQVRQSMQKDGDEDSLADALLEAEAQARSMLQVSIEREADERLRAIAQNFLADFETYFGMGGLMPVPGILDHA